MDGVEMTGTLNTTAFFQTLAAILTARDYGVELSLKSCEKANRWTSIVHRTRQSGGSEGLGRAEAEGSELLTARPERKRKRTA